MSDYASFDDLLVGNVTEEEDVKLPNGTLVKVKGLTRYEYTLSLKFSSTSGEVDMTDLEASLVHYGLSSPKLDKKQSEKWLKEVPAGVIAPILETIRRLSGLSEGADKSDVS